MRILFVADVFGSAGRRAVDQLLPGLRRELEVDFCIVNGENAASGRGITAKIADQLLATGADVITLGNWTWGQQGFAPYLSGTDRVLRPANLSPSSPGRGLAIHDDVAVINAAESLPNIRPRKITFSAYADQADFRLSQGAIVYQNEAVLRLADTKLRGSHNIENLMATLAAGMARGLSFREMVPPLCTYEPQPHRCEFVREVGGVGYINDSKATNLDAVEKALRAQTKPVILIAGGKDKGFTFDPLRSLVKEKVRSTILIGEMAESVARSWSGAVKSEIVGSLAGAVERAHAIAKPGEVVLFSPGTSSFDMFKSYADRGDQFRALVQALPK